MARTRKRPEVIRPGSEVVDPGAVRKVSFYGKPALFQCGGDCQRSRLIRQSRRAPLLFDPDRLDVGEFSDAVNSEFAAVPGPFYAAERQPLLNHWNQPEVPDRDRLRESARANVRWSFLARSRPGRLQADQVDAPITFRGTF